MFTMKRLWGPTPNYPLVQSYQHPHDLFTLIAGPCSVESEEQINQIASYVGLLGATHLRGGIFRAGTYPGKNFGWIGGDLIRAYQNAAKVNNLKNIVEVLDYRDVEWIEQFTSCFQVGARQMQNYTLLKEVGMSNKPVFLKRHPGSTMDEWLGAAEYILKHGCTELYLIERGTSSHMNHVRWDLSISIIPAVKSISKIPVIVDGSHGTGRRDLVAPMTLAGIAAGAGGCLIETHMKPEQSISDSEQALDYSDFRKLIFKIEKLRSIL